MFNKQLTDDEIIERAEEITKQRNCQHINFTMFGHNLINEATCLDCGYTEMSFVFYNSLAKRLLDLEVRLNKKLKGK